MARRRCGLAVLLVVLVAGKAGGQLPALKGWGKARPVDEAPRDPSLRAFRDTLIAIVQRHDSAALAARISPDMIYTLGGSGGGADGFFKEWSTRMPELWPTLEDILTHGGRIIEGKFWAPWTLGLPGDLDPESFYIIQDSNVVARARPDSLSRAIGTLSYEAVRGTNGMSRFPGWLAVALRDTSVVVFVPARHVKSPMGWRLSIDRYRGRWVIGMLLAGD